MSLKFRWMHKSREHADSRDVHETAIGRKRKAVSNMKIEKMVKEYILELEIKNYSPKTIKGYGIRLNQFSRWCEEEGIENIEDVSMRTVKHYVKHQMENDLKANTINSYLKVIKCFCQWAYDEEYGAFSTKSGFPWLKEQKPVIKVFTDDEVRRLLKNCGGRSKFVDIRDRTIISVFVECGIRAWELCQIKKSDIHEDYIIIHGKGARERYVPITKQLKKQMILYERALEKWYPDSKQEWYFISFYDKQLTNSSLNTIFENRSDGIEQARVSPHTLRHYFTISMVRQNVNLVNISKLLGHTNISITQNYIENLSSLCVALDLKENSNLANL